MTREEFQEVMLHLYDAKLIDDSTDADDVAIHFQKEAEKRGFSEEEAALALITF